MKDIESIFACGGNLLGSRVGSLPASSFETQKTLGVSISLFEKERMGWTNICNGNLTLCSL